MGKSLDFFKNNFLSIFLVLVVLYLLFYNNRGPVVPLQRSFAPSTTSMMGQVEDGMGISRPSFYPESTNLDADERKVVEENYLSLQVSNVSSFANSIIERASALGGFMVNMNLSSPEETESGSVTVRVPSNNSDEFINYLEQNAQKVVSKSISGRDITDEYTDIQERLRILQQNKARLEEIMEQAETASEILEVQQPLFNIQDQIENLQGRVEYLENVSESVKITAYLSTDQYALPYIPDTSWRPKAIFKEAVRGLVTHARALGSALIWVSVYSIIWIPALAVFIYVKRRFINK